MIRRPPRSTRVRSSAASDVYKRQGDLTRGISAVIHQFDDFAYSPIETLEGASKCVCAAGAWHVGQPVATFTRDDDLVTHNSHFLPKTGSRSLGSCKGFLSEYLLGAAARRYSPLHRPATLRT